MIAPGGVTPTLLVSSPGGVGTTALLEFLAAQPGVRVNPPHGFRNPLKHAVVPPAGAGRAIFLFGCPQVGLLSLFRRGYDALHHANVRGLLPPDLDLPSEDPWARTVARFGLRPVRPGVWVDGQGRYADEVGALDFLRAERRRRADARALVGRLARDAYGGTLAGYLECGEDLFRRREQLERWSSDAPYPVLWVRYEALWTRLPEVLAFAGLPEGAGPAFPPWRPRRSRLGDLATPTRARLEALYGEVSRRLAARPDVELRPAGR